MLTKINTTVKFKIHNEYEILYIIKTNKLLVKDTNQVQNLFTSNKAYHFGIPKYAYKNEILFHYKGYDTEMAYLQLLSL